MARVVGLDLGTRRIGVAVSDAGRTMAFPRAAIPRHSDRDADHRAVAGVVAEVGADVVVVGLPLSLDGTAGPAARAAREEAAQLAAALDAGGAQGTGTGTVRVETLDERFTTVEAEAALQSAGLGGRARRRRVDSAAATVLLQSWLDSR